LKDVLFPESLRKVNVSDVVITPATVVQQMVVSSGSFGFSKWSQPEKQRAADKVNVFVNLTRVRFLLMDQCMMDLWVVERVQLSWSQSMEMTTNARRVKLLVKKLLLSRANWKVLYWD